MEALSVTVASDAVGALLPATKMRLAPDLVTLIKTVVLRLITSINAAISRFSLI